MTEMLKNRTVDEINVGDAASLTWALQAENLETWAAVTGDGSLMRAFDFATRQGPGSEATGNSMWVAGLFGTIVGNELPGVGSVIRSVNLSLCERPLAFGTSVTATATVTSKDAAQGTVTLQCRCVDDRGTEYVKGTVEVVAPRQKIREPLRELPTVQVRREDRFLELLRRCEGIAPANTAVVHPCMRRCISQGWHTELESEPGQRAPPCRAPQTPIGHHTSPRQRE